ncbi:MAG: ExbD/TolR family protein [Deltaproteobacteria bacterium]|jgi:biopolymer transport protein ExbD|nr:ExbD/TolR family protein [Deltaproteobacteria bacterium]
MNRQPFGGAEELGAISEINVTPFIDIMLVLLIIFMVTAPLMLGGVQVNLPKTGGEIMPRTENPLVVSLDSEKRVFIDRDEVLAADRHLRFQVLARESANGEVLVRGDGSVPYSEMMNLMAALGRAGFTRVTLVADVRQSGSEHEDRPAGQIPTAPAVKPSESSGPPNEPELRPDLQ